MQHRKIFSLCPEVTVFLTKAISYTKLSAVDLTKDNENEEPNQNLVLQNLEQQINQLKLENEEAKIKGEPNVKIEQI